MVNVIDGSIHTEKDCWIELLLVNVLTSKVHDINQSN